MKKKIKKKLIRKKKGGVTYKYNTEEEILGLLKTILNDVFKTALSDKSYTNILNLSIVINKILLKFKYYLTNGSYDEINIKTFNEMTKSKLSIYRFYELLFIYIETSEEKIIQQISVYISHYINIMFLEILNIKFGIKFTKYYHKDIRTITNLFLINNEYINIENPESYYVLSNNNTSNSLELLTRQFYAHLYKNNFITPDLLNSLPRIYTLPTEEISEISEIVEVASSDSPINHLQEPIKDRDDLVKKQNEIIELLKKSFDKTHQELITLFSETISNNSSLQITQENNVKDKINELEEIIISLQKTLEKYSVDNQTEKENIMRLQETLTSIKSQNDKCAVELEKEKNTNNTLNIELENIVLSIEQISEKYEKIITKIKSKEDIEKIQNEIDSLNKEMKVFKESHEQYLQHDKESNLKIKSLEDRLKLLTEKNESLQRELEKQQEKNKSLEDELNKALVLIESIENITKSIEGDTTNNKELIVSQKKQIDELQESIKRLESINKSNISKIEVSNKDYEKINTVLKIKLKELKNKNKKLAQELLYKEHVIEKLKEESSEYIYGDTIKNLDNIKKNSDDKIDKLIASLENLKKKFILLLLSNKNQEIINKKINEIQLLKVKLNSLKESLTNLKDDNHLLFIHDFDNKYEDYHREFTGLIVDYESMMKDTQLTDANETITINTTQSYYNPKINLPSINKTSLTPLTHPLKSLTPLNLLTPPLKSLNPLTPLKPSTLVSTKKLDNQRKNFLRGILNPNDTDSDDDSDGFKAGKYIKKRKIKKKLKKY